MGQKLVAGFFGEKPLATITIDQRGQPLIKARSQEAANELAALVEDITARPLQLRTGFTEKDDEGHIRHTTVMRTVTPRDRDYLPALADALQGSAGTALSGRKLAGRRMRASILRNPKGTEALIVVSATSSNGTGINADKGIRTW